MHRTSRRNQRRAGGRAGAVALLLAGALALTACSASDDGSGTAPDLSSGKRQGQGATGGGAPAPDAAAPGTGRSAAPGGEGAADTARPKPEAPDYLSTFALDAVSYTHL